MQSITRWPTKADIKSAGTKKLDNVFNLQDKSTLIPIHLASNETGDECPLDRFHQRRKPLALDKRTFSRARAAKHVTWRFANRAPRFELPFIEVFALTKTENEGVRDSFLLEFPLMIPEWKILISPIILGIFHQIDPSRLSQKVHQ